MQSRLPSLASYRRTSRGTRGTRGTTRGTSGKPARTIGALALSAALALGTILVAGPAAAVSVGFSCITNNLAADCAVGEAQLAVEVTDAGGGLVLFEFSNAGPSASSITDVYFDDGTLLGIAGLVDMDDDALGDFGDPDVDFSQSAAPPDLPGGNAVGFNVTAGFLADSDPPVSSNGVNVAETLGIVFELQAGGVLQDVIDELTDGTLRIGIHVQAFDGGGSESFVNVPVPEPGTGLLLGLGLVAIGARARRRA